MTEYDTEVKTRIKDLTKSPALSTGPLAENAKFTAQILIYQELEKKLLKYSLRLDMYHMVKHLLKFHSKETILGILKTHHD